MEVVSNNNKVAFGIIITAVWALFPVLTVPLIFFLIYRMNPRDYSLKYMCFLVGLTIGLIAYTAVSVSKGEPTDLTRYTTHFRNMAAVETFGDFLITAFVSDGGIYVLYEVVTLCMAKLFPHNPQVFPLFWVGTTYFFLLLGARELAHYKGQFSRNTFLILMIMSLMGVTLFTQEVELIKQSVATAVASFAIFRKLNGKKRTGWIFFAAIMIHSSAILFLPIIFLYKKKWVNGFHLVLLGIVCVLAFIDLNKVISLIGPAALAEKASFYSKIDNWTITKINYFMFCTYTLLMLVILWWYGRNRKYISEYDRWSFNVNILAFCLLAQQYSSIHNFVRFTYLYSPFYLFAFFTVYRSSLRREERISVVTGYIIMMLLNGISYLYIYLNSDYTNAFMDNDVFQLLTSNVVLFLKYNAVN